MSRTMQFYAKLINQRSNGNLSAEVTKSSWQGGRKCSGGRIYVRGPVEYSASVLNVKDQNGNTVLVEETGAGRSAGAEVEVWMWQNGLLQKSEATGKAVRRIGYLMDDNQ